MSVMVYSRLADLLHARSLTVHDLQQRIATRFGLVVDTRSLDRLVRAERVRRPDLEIAAAAAAVLDVGLDDIFAVEVLPAGEEAIASAIDAEDDILTPEQSQRLEELFNLRSERTLSPDELAELRSLVHEYGYQAREHGLRVLAEHRGLPLDRVRAEVSEDFDRAVAWWEEIQADPVRLEALVREAQEYPPRWARVSYGL